jgi:hypothetical protein
MRYERIIYIGGEDKYSLFHKTYCCNNYIYNNIRITHLNKELVCIGLDYKTGLSQQEIMGIQNSLIITEENWKCPEFIQKEINRIFFSNKIRTNCIIVENPWTIARYWKEHFNIEIVVKNDRTTNRFELMEIE